MLNYTTLKNQPREFLALTGLHVAEFEKLLPAYQAAYARRYPPTLTATGQPRQRRVGGGAKGQLGDAAQQLLFVLVYLKTNPLQTAHGAQFGLRQPQTNYWLHRLLPVVRAALQDLGAAPEREGPQVATSDLVREGTHNLVIDGTERRRQRPQARQAQREHYSGKKKTHTDKNIVLLDATTRKIVYLGPTEPGACHDKKAADRAAITYPPQTRLGKDTGFQGYEPAGVQTYQPKKKPRGRALSVGDQFLNHVYSSVRIVVEHGLAGVKRCRIVKEVLRLTLADISDLVMELACGLHNLRMACRHPLPTIDIFQQCRTAYS